MIRNGVIDAQKEFVERRYRADTNRSFENLRLEAMEKYGIDIECCHATFVTAQGEIFALFGDILVETISNPPRIEPWADAKKRISEERV
jgi:hypothetical protein